MTRMICSALEVVHLWLRTQHEKKEEYACIDTWELLKQECWHQNDFPLALLWMSDILWSWHGFDPGYISAGLSWVNEWGKLGIQFVRNLSISVSGSHPIASGCSSSSPLESGRNHTRLDNHWCRPSVNGSCDFQSSRDYVALSTTAIRVQHKQTSTMYNCTCWHGLVEIVWRSMSLCLPSSAIFCQPGYNL